MRIGFVAGSSGLEFACAPRCQAGVNYYSLRQTLGRFACVALRVSHSRPGFHDYAYRVDASESRRRSACALARL